ncbi:SelT-like protein [Blattella germanica]|nr:SelT-like protein [Blattella germanica]
MSRATYSKNHSMFQNSIAKMLIIMGILSGFNIFDILGQGEPLWWKWCVDNKLYSCMMLFFLCNALEGHFMSTGAFEITLNDVPVWSKLQTGRIPQTPELFQIIDNHLQFQTKVELKPGYAK